ncbi:MAG: RNA pseudouridine synthase [Bacteroidales bacterium]|nr:RNA pseudouridine synthase [Bacteroidales bacterium]
MEYRNLTEQEYKDLENRILYEDNHLLIVCKKAGEIVQGDKTGDEPLCDKYKAFIAIRNSKPGKVFLGIPHRLDRPVSGITVFAKTSKALERLSESFREGAVRKIYLALCTAAPAQPHALLENWLIRKEAMNKSFITEKGRFKDAKLAKLIYTHLGDTDRYHLIQVELLTGRHHQIRCQLAGIGCTIKGDLKYGAPRSNPDGSISLHAWSISLPHPVTKAPVQVQAPVPSSWKGVSALLTAHPLHPGTNPGDSY